MGIEDMSKEDAIKFFRKFIAEREGLSEEEAGASINKSVGVAIELVDPLWELSTIINSRIQSNYDEAVKITMIAISSLLTSFPIEMRKAILIDLMTKTIDNAEKSAEELGKKMEEYRRKQ